MASVKYWDFLVAKVEPFTLQGGDKYCLHGSCDLSILLKEGCLWILESFYLANVVWRMPVREENYSYLSLHIWNCVRESVILGKIPTLFFRVVLSEFFSSDPVLWQLLQKKKWKT